MAATAMINFKDLLKKDIFSAAERFQLLVKDVLMEHATPPPVSPEKSGIYLVDKVLCDVDWKHTTTSWLNRNTKVRLFTKLIDDAGTESWRNQEIKPNQIKKVLDGEGYLLRVTYYNHANPKYSEVKRIISEVQGFKDNDFGKLEVGWFRLICNQCHYNYCFV